MKRKTKEMGLELASLFLSFAMDNSLFLYGELEMLVANGHEKMKRGKRQVYTFTLFLQFNI